jgi:hypothetical protein
MIGFSDKHLRGVGDGSPVQQPPVVPLAHGDRTLLVLDPPPAKERTMRDLTLESLENAAKSKKSVSFETVASLNGGRAPLSDIGWREATLGTRATVTFFGEPGLTVPGVLYPARGTENGFRIYVSDDGKAAEIARTPPDPAYSALYLDLLGTGELGGVELRYPIYLGRSVPFIGGNTLARAAAHFRKDRPRRIEVVARGPLSTLAATYAALLDPSLEVRGTDALRTWADYLGPDVPEAAVQPRAHLMGRLEDLRKPVKGSWEYRQVDPSP